MRPPLRRMLAVASIASLLEFTLSDAQKVKDLTDHAPTVEEIIDGLKQPGAPTGQPRMRGIDLSGKAAPAQCEQYRQQAKARARGVKLTEEAKGIAMTITFATNSAQLTADAKQTLDTLGKALTSTELTSSCFQIEGHTDDVGKDSYNLTLSQRRAQSVEQYLAAHFKTKERTVAVGYGEEKPIADNTTADGRQKNRRVQVVNVSSAN